MVLIDSLNKTIPGGQKLTRGANKIFSPPPLTKILNTRLCEVCYIRYGTEIRFNFKGLSGRLYGIFQDDCTEYFRTTVRNISGRLYGIYFQDDCTELDFQEDCTEYFRRTVRNLFCLFPHFTILCFFLSQIIKD